MHSIRFAATNDQTTWDKYVLSKADCSPYHLFAWGEAVSQTYGHKPHYLLAETATGIIGVLPIIEMKRPIFGNNPVSLPFCDLGGPLADSDEIAAALKIAAESIPGLQKDIEYRENSKPGCMTELSGEKVRMILELPPSSETLLKGFKSKLRSQINKAKKNGLKNTLAQPLKNQQLLAEFYQVFSTNMHELGSPVHAKKWFEQLSLTYGERCLVSIVYLEQIAVAGGMILIAGNKASIPWASTISDYNKLSPNMLLYWSLLEYCSDHGISEFDFGRSTYDEGTYRFKAQWGAAPKPLHWHTGSGDCIRQTSGTGSTISESRRIAEAIWRKVPLRLTTKFGPVIRKHISL